MPAKYLGLEPSTVAKSPFPGKTDNILIKQLLFARRQPKHFLCFFHIDYIATFTVEGTRRGGVT